MRNNKSKQKILTSFEANDLNAYYTLKILDIYLKLSKSITKDIPIKFYFVCLSSFLLNDKLISVVQPKLINCQ